MSREYQVDSTYVSETTDDEYQLSETYLNETVTAAATPTTIELPTITLAI